MKTLFKSSTLLVLFIILLAGLARFWKSEYVPSADDGDELAYIFSGESLLQYGQPISWSSFENKKSDWQTVVFTEAESPVNHSSFFPLIRPWFDQTPFVPLMIGGWVKLAGYGFPSMPPALWYRLPMVILSTLSLGLVFLIGQKIFNREAGLFSVVLLGFSPVFMFAGRMVVSENVILFFVLSALYLYLEKRWLFFVVLASIFAGLCKPTGLVIVPIIAGALFFDKRYKEAFLYAGAVIMPVILFIVGYGYALGGGEFFLALKHQSFRLLGWSNPAFLLANPGFHTKPVLDFSYFAILLLGMMSFALPGTKYSKLLHSSIIWFLVTIWVTGAEQDMLGWYKIPLFAVLGISAGALVFHKKYLPAITLVAITILSNVGFVRFPTHPLPDAPVLRAAVGIFLLGFLSLNYFNVPEKWQKNILAGVCVIFILQGLYVADSYFDALCRDRICATPTVTFTQTLKELF